MPLFKRLKFITFTSIALFIELLAGYILTVAYSPTIPFKGYELGVGPMFIGPGSEGKNHLYPVTVANPTTWPINMGMILIFMGVVYGLVDHILDIYKPQNKTFLKVLRWILGSSAIIYVLLWIVAIFFIKNKLI